MAGVDLPSRDRAPQFGAGGADPIRLLECLLSLRVRWLADDSTLAAAIGAEIGWGR
jgi:hypothetical protein